MPNEQKPHSFWTSIPGILTGTAALLTAVVGLMLAIKPEPANTIFITTMEASSLSCREICQARGAVCVSARVPSQESGVAGCTFTGVRGSLRSRSCLCRKV